MTSSKFKILDSKSQSGQSLFEVVLAIGISALIITAVVALALNSIQNSSYSKDKTLATSYVQEAMEWLRGQRDENTNLFRSYAIPGTIYCLDNLSWTAASAGCISERTIGDTKFTRELTFSDCESCSENLNVIEVRIMVSWSDSKGEHSVTSSTDLSFN